MKLSALFRKKSCIAPTPASNEDILHRCLNAFDLTLMGIGAIIGAGVFVLTGLVAATKAGPGVTISYVLAGIASMLAALSYAELATSIGGCGSAYSYAYAGFGEFIAWIIGWNLIFEYALSVSTVAIGWSGYFNELLEALHINLPPAFLKTPFEGGIINLPAVIIIGLLGTVLCIGIRQSARFNAIVVAIKLITIFLFISVACFHLDFTNWHPYLPFGWDGVIQGGALVFFAYIGFDALSTAVEETKDPQKSLPIAIIASMIICTLIYVIMSAVMTAVIPYTRIGIESPVADTLQEIGYQKLAGFISVGALAGLTTVILVMYYGLTRICFAIARDGLLPLRFSKVNGNTKTPTFTIGLAGIIMALIAGMVPLGEAAALVNIGTLTAFVFVCIGVIVFRVTHPGLPRPFKLPFNPIIPGLGIVSCLFLMINLPLTTWIRFVIWLALGIFIYFTYSQKNSLMQK